MGRPKGRIPRMWTQEEKLRIVKRYFDEDLGVKRLAREENIDHGMLNRWIHRYMEEGADGLSRKYKRKAKLLSALPDSKNLCETDRLKLIIAKQEIEIEQLKKEYQEKGAGADRESVLKRDVDIML